MTTATKRKPISGYRTMTAAQRYNARMERIMDECKDAKTRFNLSSREDENGLQAEVDELSAQLAANHARLSPTTTEKQVVTPSPRPLAQMIVDWYEGRTFNGQEERTAIYNAARTLLN